MVFEFLIIYRAMMEQASTLDRITKDELKAFSEYLEIMSFSERKPTKQQKEIYKKIEKALIECPRTNLEITKARRDMVKLMVEPKGNARLYGLEPGFFKGMSPTEYDPKKDDHEHLWGIAEMRPDKPFKISIDSFVGQIVSGEEVFRLYGQFKDYNDPKKVSRNNRGFGYPIERIDAPEKEIAITLPLNNKWVPAFMFVGNRLDCCNDALVYVASKYWDAPKDFHKVVEDRAGWFVIHNVTNKLHLDEYETIKKLESEIAQLERIVGAQRR